VWVGVPQKVREFCIAWRMFAVNATSVESSIVCCWYSLNVTEDGKKALITLANGDMRKVLNVLQVMVLLTVF